MELYTKLLLKSLINKMDNKKPQVCLIKWTDADIAQFKLGNLERLEGRRSEATESATSSKIGKVWCCNIIKLMDASLLENYYIRFEMSHKILKPSKNDESESPVITSKNSTGKNSDQTINFDLCEIEHLYHKYFRKSVYDNIIIICNILKIIMISNNYHKSQIDESLEKKTEAEHLKYREKVDKMYIERKKILESKLEKYFSEVISGFNNSDFELAFQIFYSCILSVFKILDEPKLEKSRTSNNLLLLTCNSLKISELGLDKIFITRLKNIRPYCISLICLIEDSQNNDPGITDRMPLFFMLSVNSLNYFKMVMDSVTGNSNENLELLIDNAASQYCDNSEYRNFLDASSSSTMENNLHITTSVTSFQSTSNNNGSFKHSLLAESRTLQVSKKAKISPQ